MLFGCLNRCYLSLSLSSFVVICLVLVLRAISCVLCIFIGNPATGYAENKWRAVLDVPKLLLNNHWNGFWRVSCGKALCKVRVLRMHILVRFGW